MIWKSWIKECVLSITNVYEFSVKKKKSLKCLSLKLQNPQFSSFACQPYIKIISILVIHSYHIYIFCQWTTFKVTATFEHNLDVKFINAQITFSHSLQLKQTPAAELRLFKDLKEFYLKGFISHETIIRLWGFDGHAEIGLTTLGIPDENSSRTQFTTESANIQKATHHITRNRKQNYSSPQNPAHLVI